MTTPDTSDNNNNNNNNSVDNINGNSNVDSDTLLLVVVLCSFCFCTTLAIVIVFMISFHRKKKLEVEEKKIESKMMAMKLEEMNKNSKFNKLKQKQNNVGILASNSVTPLPSNVEVDLGNTSDNEMDELEGNIGQFELGRYKSEGLYKDNSDDNIDSVANDTQTLTTMGEPIADGVE